MHKSVARMHKHDGSTEHPMNIMIWVALGRIIDLIAKIYAVYYIHSCFEIYSLSTFEKRFTCKSSLGISSALQG